MLESEIIQVRRGFFSPDLTVAQPEVLIVVRSAKPKSGLDPLKRECPGAQVIATEPQIATLQRGFKKECGLDVVSVIDQKGYDYSRPSVVLGKNRALLYVVHHFPVILAPFKLDDIVLSSEHTHAEFVDLLEIAKYRRNIEDSPFRRSTVLSADELAQDLGLLPKLQDEHPELFPEPSPPPSY